MDVGATRARARAGCRSAALLALVGCQVTLRLDGYDFGGSGGSGGDSSTSTLQPGRAGGDASPTAPPTDATDASDVPSNTGAMPPDAADVPPSAGDVPRNSLGLWFLADDGVIAQPDGSISTWSDRSGNGQDASQPVLAQRPTLELRDDGMPMVSFDGTNDSFVLPPGFAAFDGASFFAVVEALPNPRCAGLLHFSNGPDVDDVEFGRHQTNLLYYEVVDDFINGTPEGFVTDRRLVLSIVQAGPDAEAPGRVELRIDGSLDQVDVVRLPATVARRVNYLGQNAYTRQPALCSAYFRGRMGEVLFYPRGLAADERARVEAYLHEKWQAPAGR